MIEIEFNGQPEQLQQAPSLLALIESKQLNPKALALVLNQQVVPRSRWQAIQCQPNDKVDVFSAVAGG
ncbi:MULTISPECIES: sulfur carrier protein ThiS [unclassified Shewanella]|uniref:sulfur carrier protein ThiS n=1 Tax=unclassified Shewanella TaxID=196818 RepID=UPI000C851443|nr:MULTISPECIES: sulfur carrier protein ThiS [unclassified Shewanella]MDO6620203.1 sulfur carrier protein ThiS [Shewanella sp. 6_MG-2023]MDO6641557.1 sulfur carrier protein ThiS [Shewanella sp. 5_MG-2023]MDO6679916.1 sulfur carrier protein ThiS [Shewanella sp. 4_MG-2023]MDO6776871.1 sulfur carrier protein ThiS [Shewanella sp. 3_MG-2023]PMG31723.1 thiamine biosynthesis protein ThiS [Shewanella sp. 10N.286.52.C2]